MTPLQKRADSMISKMRARAAEKVAESGRVTRRKRSVPFGVAALREWLMRQSLEGTGELWSCRYCTRRLTVLQIECDHVVPLTRDGSFGLENLAVACRLCNQTKGGMSVEAFHAIRTGLESFPAADRAYILKCLRTHGIGQRLRFPAKPQPTAAAEQEPNHHGK